MAALPDVIGSTIGNLIAGAAQGGGSPGDPGAKAYEGDGIVEAWEGPDSHLAELAAIGAAKDREAAMVIAAKESAGAATRAAKETMAIVARNQKVAMAANESFGATKLDLTNANFEFYGDRPASSGFIHLSSGDPPLDENNQQLRNEAIANLNYAINRSSTSPAARDVLRAFLTGRGPREFYYGPDSAGLHELFETSPGAYYIREEREAMNYMAYTKYRTGVLREGYNITQYTFRDFNPIDGARGFLDGIQMGDITGTLSSGITARVHGDLVYFHAENSMNLVSYAGGNLIPSQQSRIISPATGPLSPIKMVFEWSRPIPPYLRPR
jgi:hypothetical protein